MALQLSSRSDGIRRFAPWSDLNGGTFEIVAPVAGRRILVLAFFVGLNAPLLAGTLLFRETVTALALLGPAPFSANGYFSASSPSGLFQTAEGRGIEIVVPVPSTGSGGGMTFVEN